MSDTDHRSKELVQRIVQLREKVQEWKAAADIEACDSSGEWDEDLKIARHAVEVCDAALTTAWEALRGEGYSLCTKCEGMGVITIDCDECSGTGCIPKEAKP